MKYQLKTQPTIRTIAECYVEYNLDNLIKVHETIWEYNKRTHTWGAWKPDLWISQNFNGKLECVYPDPKNPSVLKMLVWENKGGEKGYYDIKKEAERILEDKIETNDEFFKNAPKGLMFDNCFVFVEDNKKIVTEPPQKKHAALLKYDMDYNPVTVPPKNTDDFLKRFGVDEAVLLWEMIGTSLLGLSTTRGIAGKALFIAGPTGSGKSTLIDYICTLHKHHHTEIKSSAFSTHGLVGLETKRVLYSHEIGMKRRWNTDYMEYMKKIVSGDPITINPKNKPEYVVNPRALVIMAGNKLPGISTFDKAFVNRFIYMQLTTPIGTIIPEFHKTLEAEKEEAICYAINCVAEMLKRPVDDKSMCQYTIPQSCAVAKEEVSKSDKTYRFFAECLEITPYALYVAGNKKIPNERLRSTQKSVYEYYKIWCIDEGVKDDQGVRDFNESLRTWCEEQMREETDKGKQLKNWYPNGVQEPRKYRTNGVNIFPFTFKVDGLPTPLSADYLVKGVTA